jgi:hypothetical protein
VRLRDLPTHPAQQPDVEMTPELAAAMAAEIVAHRRALHGDATMLDDDPDDDDQDDDAGDPDDDDQDDDAGDPDDDDQDDDADKGKDRDKKLGPAGQRALDRERERRKKATTRAEALARENRDLKAAAARAGKPRSKAKGKDDPDDDEDDVDLDAVREEGRAEEREKSNRRTVRAAAIAAASGRLASPKLAGSLLERQLKDIEPDEDGEVDEDELEELIDALLDKHPELAAGAEKPRKRGNGADSGVRRSKEKPAASLEESVQRALRDQERAARRSPRSTRR